MEGAVILLDWAWMSGLPLETINAVANTITAAAVLWAARILRRSITDIRLLHLQPPLSGLLRDAAEHHRRVLREQDGEAPRDA